MNNDEIFLKKENNMHLIGKEFPLEPDEKGRVPIATHLIVSCVTPNKLSSVFNDVLYNNIDNKSSVAKHCQGETMTVFVVWYEPFNDTTVYWELEKFTAASR